MLHLSFMAGAHHFYGWMFHKCHCNVSWKMHCGLPVTCGSSLEKKEPRGATQRRHLVGMHSSQAGSP